MKKTVLKNEQSAKDKGLYANWAFVHDKVISPNGVDITQCSKEGEERVWYEVSIMQYDGSVVVYEANKKEIEKCQINSLKQPKL